MKNAMTAAMLAVCSVASIAQTGIPMEKVAAGERSGIAAARQVVVRNETEWQQLWSEVGTRQATPVVDFHARMIVGVFLGMRSTSGFSVQFVEVREDSGEMWVKYAERRPSPRTPVLQVLTAPFVLVSVPKHEGSVRFGEVTVLPRAIR
jgi:hypothetical protein